MDHYYKYEGLREEDRNGLIPFMHVSEALRIDPEDREQRPEPVEGPQCDTQPNKTPSRRHAGPRNGYVRKTRDVYILLGNYGNGFEEEGPEADTWKEMKQLLKEYRENCPQYRYSYRRKRIRINTQ